MESSCESSVQVRKRKDKQRTKTHTSNSANLCCQTSFPLAISLWLAVSWLTLLGIIKGLNVESSGGGGDPGGVWGRILGALFKE